jgi:hypothetical protein
MNIWLTLVVAVTFFCLGNLWNESNREVPVPFPAPGEVFTMIPSGESYEWTCGWKLTGGSK